MIEEYRDVILSLASALVSGIIAIVVLTHENFTRTTKIVLYILTGLLFLFSFVYTLSSKQSANTDKLQLLNTIADLQHANDSISTEYVKNVRGDGFLVASFMGAIKPNYYGIMLENKNDYPSFSIAGTIDELKHMKLCAYKITKDSVLFDYNCLVEHGTNIALITEVQRHSNAFINDFGYASKDKYVSFEIKLTSRNIATLQQSVVQLRWGVCAQSYRIWELIGLDSARLITEHNELPFKVQWDKEFIPVMHRIAMPPRK